MNRPTASKIMVIADHRTAASGREAAVRRFRLARLRLDGGLPPVRRQSAGVKPT